MVTLENPSNYHDEDGNRIECGGRLGENVTVIFRGRNNALIVDRGARLSHFKVMFDCNEGICEIGANRFKGTIRVGESASVTIGDKVTCTAHCYISTAERASVTIGQDCMLASRNEIRADDAHPIFSVATGKRVNMPKDIHIGSHVWLGAGASVLGGARIGDGSVIGFGSIVKSHIPNNCVAAGIPAKVVRRDIAWERPHLTLDEPYIKPDATSIKKSPYWKLTDDSLLGARVVSVNPACVVRAEERAMTTSEKLTVVANAAVPNKAGKTDVTIALADLQARGIAEVFAENPDLRILRVDHSALNSGESNLLDLAIKLPSVREVMVELANRNFFAYMLKDQVTSLVHFRYIGKLWKRVTKGEFQVDENGLVHSVQLPLAGHSPKRLLVVFSSIAGRSRTSSLMRHFEQNFSSVQKYVPAGTAVLRIADFGGVVGGFYLNSYGLPATEPHVQSLIRRMAQSMKVPLDEVVLYGASKGGTASLYHGVLGGYRVVSVDPILADEHYIKQFRDSHFTVGVFPKDKCEKFECLSSNVDPATLAPIVVVCSERSPQFPYIDSVLREPLKGHIAFFNSLHPDIKVHPDVSPKTLNIAVMLINMMFYKLPVAAGVHAVDEVVHRKDAHADQP